ncbi:MAG TPA: polysaccharide deacetylase family protein [Gemmatimonadales bacterium]|jgi:peptidoglycan/xylan/chitin deacetylase (PgdA/CDA1 family)|nr:polysaccharide deacetylase family protein [Gemmatimonadales bacterium]
MTLASLCYRALQRSGFTALARRLSRGGVVLCYHNVVAETHAGPWSSLGLHMPLPTFDRQMRWLARAYEVVSLAELVNRLAAGVSLRGVAAVTFDDGYNGVFDDAWPLLQDLGMPAAVFVVAEAPERDHGFWWDDPDVLADTSPARRQHWLTALRGDGPAIVGSLAVTHRALPHRSAAPRWCRPASWQTIAAAARSGLQLGAHSASHRSLLELSEHDLQHEIVDSRNLIERRTGVRPAFFAYPYGFWNERVRRAVQAAGYRAAFTLDGGGNNHTADNWALSRVNVPAHIEHAAFQAWTAGLNLWRRNGS